MLFHKYICHQLFYMKVLSPVTGIDNTTLEMNISTQTIIEKYKALGISVSRFFLNMQNIELRKCNATGYRFYYPETIFGDDKFYEELQKTFNDYYVNARWEHIISLNLIKKDDRVLEVGSGSGFFLKQLKNAGINATGLELNSHAVKEGQSKGLNIINQLLDEHVKENNGKYDVVCSYQVLEHIYDVRGYFENALRALKPGGKIIIGVPNNNPFIFKHDIYHTLNLPPHHAGLWNKQTFQNIGDHFPLQLESTFIEPLSELKQWYQVQVQHHQEHNRFLGSLLAIIPRPFYKMFLNLFSNKIEGRNIIAVFKKL